MFDDSSSTAEVFREAITNLLSGVCVAKPGLVRSSGSERVDVLPMVSRKDSEGVERVYGEIKDVLILWPGGGGWEIKSELGPGDIVFLIFADHPLDEWKEKLSLVSPEANRSHALTDAVAIPTTLGVSTGGTFTIQNAAGIGMEMTSTKITFTVPNVEVSGLLTAGTAVPGAGVTLNTHTHTVSDGATASPTPGT